MRLWQGVGVAAVALAASGAGSVAPARAGSEDPEGRAEVFTFTSGPRLGVALADVAAGDLAGLKLAEERGAVVKEVTGGSPADKAGLRQGDVILSWQGETVRSVAQLRRLVRETPPGRRVAFEVSRDGATQRLSATLEAPRRGAWSWGEDLHLDVPAPPVPPVPPLAPLIEEKLGRELFREGWLGLRRGRLGLSYQELSGQLARYFKVEDGALLVTEVEEGGPAGKAGLRAGDVIVKVDGKDVTEAEVLRDALFQVPAEGEVTISVHRDGRPLELKVAPRDRGRPRAPRTTI